MAYDSDIFYVIQNGSLLLIDHTSKFYDIYDDYCVENMDNNIVAVICNNEDVHPLHKLSKIQTQATAICMLISVPCLLVTAFFHLAIPKLRNLHGETLAGHSLCLACGFGLLGLTQIGALHADFIGKIFL